jgi:tripartite-type tricarboxylate transporter receptor subunit TctC
MNKRISFIFIFLVFFFGWMPGTFAADSSYPSKPVRIISIFPPGGGNDTLCRIVAQKLTERLKQQDRWHRGRGALCAGWLYLYPGA